MNKLYKLTYYTFGWLIVSLLNLRHFKQSLVPRWFWAVDWYFPGDFGYNIVWLGIFQIAWWEDYFSWDWNFD